MLLEAIASGLPVITCNTPPFTEFLSKEQALLVNPDSIQGIANALQLVFHPNIAHSLIQNSSIILANYSWKKSAKIHVNCYYKMLDKVK